MSAPLRTKDDAIRLAIVTRLPWIRRRQEVLREQPRQSAREMVTGETHYYRDRAYRLSVIESDDPPSVRLRPNRRIEIMVRPGSTREQREAVLLAWYRERLREKAEPLFEKWQAIVGAPVEEWRIKRMRTKWGTCNRAARRIWINLELAKKAPACLEYIVVHELVNLLERNHNERFVQHMDRVLPHWERRRDQLNRAPLSHETWGY